MSFQDIVAAVRDGVVIKQVFAKPHTENGVTVIAAAKVYGGGGGGSGHDAADEAGGGGGGTGMVARPVGAYVIDRDGRVRWIPAFDVNRAVLLAALLGWVLLRFRRGRRRGAADQ